MFESVMSYVLSESVMSDVHMILNWLRENGPIFQSLSGIVATVGIIALFRQWQNQRKDDRNQRRQFFPNKLKFQIHEEFVDRTETEPVVRLGINDLSLPLDIRTLLLSKDIATAMVSAMLGRATTDSTLLRLKNTELQTRMYEELAGVAGTFLPAGVAPLTFCIHGETGHSIKRRIIRIVFYTDAEVRRYTQEGGADHLHAEKPHQAVRILAVLEACQFIRRGFTEAVVKDDDGFVVAHRVRDPRAAFAAPAQSPADNSGQQATAAETLVLMAEETLVTADEP
jgi:hypothetical protein